MADHLSPAGRSRVMARIRSRNTTPELALRRALFAQGVRGWRCHAKRLPGKPDLAFTRWRIAVFVDGCFWHGHPDFFTFGKSGAVRVVRRELRARRCLIRGPRRPAR